MLSRRMMIGAMLMSTISLALVGCGGGGPEGTVKKWFNAMNEGKHSEAVKYLAPALAEFAKMDGGKAMSDDMTNSGTMSKLEIVSSEVRGEGATVNARVHYKDGGVEDQTVTLVKIDGDWKVTL